MAGLLNISEPNANNHSHNNTDSILNNNNASHDFLATLATDATNTKQQAASKHSREQIAQLFDLPLMEFLWVCLIVCPKNIPICPFWIVATR